MYSMVNARQLIPHPMDTFENLLPPGSLFVEAARQGPREDKFDCTFRCHSDCMTPVSPYIRLSNKASNPGPISRQGGYGNIYS